MNNVLQRNISAIKDETIKKILNNYEYDIKPILTTTNGYNIQYNGTYLHSIENPLAESQQIFKNSLINNKNIHIIYGLGLGYLFQIAVKNSNSLIILYEPNFDILYNSLTLVDFSQELSKDNVFLFTNLDNLIKFISEKTNQNTTVDILSLPSYRELYKDSFTEEIKKIELAFGSTILDYGYKRKRLYGSTITMLQNIPTLVEEIPINELENIYKDKTAIIVSAGPTLNDNIETIKKYQDNAIIFTVGTAFKTLEKNNIKTDFLCIIESFDNSKQVKECDLSNVNLIVEPYTHKNIHKLPAKNILLHLSSNMPSSQYFADIANISTEGYLAQGTVSYMALNTAVKMGFSKIILVGQDLAYIENQCYSKDSNYEDLICEYNPNTDKYEIKAKDFNKFAESLTSYNTEEARIDAAKRRLNTLNSSLYMVKAINGKMIPTEAGYASFITHFAEYAKKISNTELINTSLKGALIEGFKNIPLKDAMIDSKKIIKKEINSNYKFNISLIMENLIKTKQNLENTKIQCEECKKIASRLNLDYKRNKTIDKNKLLKIRKLIEIYTILNNFDNNNLIFKYTTTAEEMELNDILTNVSKYDDKTTPVVISELKKYYENIINKLDKVIKVVNYSLEGLKKND